MSETRPQDPPSSGEAAPARSSPRRRKRYRAFLTYAHADRETAEWLHRVLTRTWVPFAGKRHVFLDRRSARSGVLVDVLREALSESEFLIVCGSRAARGSEWVQEELRLFLENAPPEKVLPSAVGDPEQCRMPRAILEMQRERGKASWVADLRGRPSEWDAATQRQRRGDALAILATVLGFPDKHALARWRTKLVSVAAAVVILALGVAWAANAMHRAWLRTPEGSIHRAMVGLRETVKLERVDESELLVGCRALGELGREKDLRAVAASFGSEQFRRLALAAGLSALDCSEATAELRRLDPRDASYWPEAFLHVAGACGEVTPPSARAACSDKRWIEALLNTGNFEEAARVLDVAGLPAGEAFPLRARVLLESDEVVASLELPFREWWEGTGWSAFELLHVLRAWDRLGLLDGPEAEPVLRVVADAAAEMSPRTNLEWKVLQGLLSCISAMGESAARQTALPMLLEYGMAEPDGYGGRAMASAWAERGLALQRMGHRERADDAFARAISCLREPEASSGTGGEHRDVATILCLADRWKEAVDLALGLPNGRVRAISLSEILGAWVRCRRRAS